MVLHHHLWLHVRFHAVVGGEQLSRVGGDGHTRSIRVARREPGIGPLEHHRIAVLLGSLQHGLLGVRKRRGRRGDPELDAELPELALTREPALQAGGLEGEPEVLGQEALMIAHGHRCAIVDGQQNATLVVAAESDQRRDPILIRAPRGSPSVPVR